MDIQLTDRPLNQLSTDTIVRFTYQDEPVTGLDQNALGEIKRQEYNGQSLQIALCHRPEGLLARRLILVGLGQPSAISQEPSSGQPTWRQAAAQAIRLAKQGKDSTLAFDLTNLKYSTTKTVGLLVEAMIEGALLGGYRFNHYKSDRQKEPEVAELIIVLPSDQLKVAESGRDRGLAIAESILNARDLINQPPSHIKPAQLVAAAREIAALSPNLSINILDESALKKEGYNALLAVAAGSEEKPYLVHLHYRPAKAQRRVSFVGKGVTFDSGGLGIKPWKAMLTMKSDMAGAASVLAICQMLAELESIGQPLPIEVDGVIVTTENMISGKAMRPDDIIETKNGKTIEIVHTDAEGRLILADALTYTSQLKPEYIIDFATLTGAAIAALGRQYAALMGNDEPLLGLIERASAESGELLWRLPLPDLYKKHLESSVADLQNVSSGSAPDAIFGGLFLREFVGEKIGWCHIDIAGPSFVENEDEKQPLYPKGATAYGALLGLKLLELLVEKAAPTA